MNLGTAEKPLAQVADETGYFEVAESFQFLGTLHIGNTINNPNAHENFAPRTQTTDVRNFILRDVLFAPNCLVFFKNGHKISDTKYLISEEVFRRAEIDFEHLIKDENSKPLIIGYNLGWQGYYHWLIQSLPAIDHSTRGREADVRIALPALGPWHQELLSLIGANKVELVTMNFFRHYSAKHVEYSEFMNGSSAFVISRKATETFSRLKDVALTSDRGYPRAIYVSRTDTKNRQLRNEVQLMDYLSANGVEIISPTTLSVKSQINFFANARVIIGPHGGGLSNIIFCQAGASVYELFSDHYVNPAINRLAQSAALDYWADMFPATGEGYLHDWTWEVNMEIFKDRFSAIMTHQNIRT
jgi:hypothetical protein